MTQQTFDSQEQPQQQMNDAQREIKHQTLEDVLTIESFRRYLGLQFAQRQGGAASIIGMTLNHPERAPSSLCEQWKCENAIACYLVHCFPDMPVSVDYNRIQLGCIDDENSISLDRPALCWVSLFLQASDAQAAGYPQCMSSMTAAQGWALLEVVEDFVNLFVSQ